MGGMRGGDVFLVFINAHAGWVRRQRADVVCREFQQVLGAAGRVFLTRSPAEPAQILASYEAQAVTALVPVGGDGTLSGLLAAACARWGTEQLPAVLAVAAGTMNMAARSVRTGTEAPLTTLRRVLQAQQRQCLRETRRTLLQSQDGRAGFVAGFGMPTRFLAHYYAHGGGSRQALAAIARYSGSALAGGALAQELFASEPVRLRLDEEDELCLPLNVLLAMSLQTLPLGFRVGPGRDREGMSVLFGQPRALPLIASLPFLHRGYFPPALALRRRQVTRLQLDFVTPQAWQLDGDIQPATRQLCLHARACVRFLC